MTLVAASILLFGLCLLLVTWRGRRVDRHPVCRACRYDLFRLDSPAACPECGADLTRRRAQRIGGRRRRVVPVVASLVIVVTSGAFLTMRGHQWAGAQDWNRVKPYWLLKHETTGGRFVRADAARKELLRRYHEGMLDEARIIDLIDHALVIQRDQPLYWADPWGQLIETAWSRSEINEQAFHTYLRTAVERGLKVAARERVRQGAPIVIELTTGPFPTWRESPYGITLTPKNPRIGQTDLFFPASDVFETPSVAMSGTCPLTPAWMDPWLFALPGDAALGEHTVHLSVAYEIGEHPTILKGEFETQATVTIVDAAEHVIELLGAQDRPGLQTKLRESISLACYSTSPGWGREENAPFRHVAVRIDDPPIDVAFRAVARVGDREWDLGACLAPVDQFNSTGAGTARPNMASLFNHDRCDIILRPYPELAERTLAVNSIWGEEIIYRDVPLEPAVFMAWLSRQTGVQDEESPRPMREKPRPAETGAASLVGRI